MSLIRATLILGAAVMLLPVDEKKQAAFSVTATKAAAETATFCDRNVHTCGAYLSPYLSSPSASLCRTTDSAGSRRPAFASSVAGG